MFRPTSFAVAIIALAVACSGYGAERRPGTTSPTGSPYRIPTGRFGGHGGPMPFRLRATRSGRLADQEPEGKDSDDQRLERFLASRGLDRLLIAHLEMRLDRESNPDRRAALARRLAEQYQQALLQSPGSDEDEKWIKRAETLLRLNRRWDLVGLELAVQHARFAQVEQDFRAWWFAGARESGRAAITDALREIVRQLDEIHRRSVQAFQEGQALPVTDEQEADRLNEELLKIERRVMHSQYLLGWTWLFLGITEGHKVDALHRAETFFRQFVELPDDQSVARVDARWFDAPSWWHVRAWGGLAWAERSLGNRVASDHVFQLLASAPFPEIEALLPLWQLESRVFARHWTQLADWVEQLDRMHWNRPQRVRFWLAVIESAHAAPLPPEVADQLVQAATVGLLRDFQANHLRRLIEEGRLAIRGNPFLENWLNGYLGYVRAESEQASFDAAQDALTRAMQLATPETESANRARCEYLLGLIAFRRSRQDLAIEHFRSVAETLRDEDPELAEEAAWMHVRSLAATARSDAREVGAALAAIDRWQQQFPDGLHFDAMEWTRTRLTCLVLPPNQAIRHLERISQTTDPPGGLAMELAFQTWRQWKDAFQRGSPDEPQHFEQLLQVEQQIQSDPQRSDQDRVRAALWVVDAKRIKGLPIEPIAERVDALARTVESLPDVDRMLVGQIRRLQLVLAERRGDTDRAWEIALELTDDFAGTPYEHPALLLIAERFREQPSLTADQIEQAIRCNERLIRWTGDDPETVGRSANVRVAMLELIRLYRLKGELAKAEPIARFLAERFPHQTRFVLAWARVLADQQRWGDGLPLWRQLAANAAPGSDLWYESKWQLIRGLARTDAEQAARVLKQTRLLSPQMPVEWSGRFEELSRRMRRQEAER